VKPATVSVSVGQSPRQVFEFLDLLANHQAFLGHLFTDWGFSGPSRGVGARAEARTNVPGSQDWTDFEVIESEPGRIVEQEVGAKGKRHTRGTYLIEAAPGGGTKISFELAWVEASRWERLLPPLTRAFTRRAYGKAMRRLARQLKQG
jgi:hypothetical protein